VVPISDSCGAGVLAERAFTGSQIVTFTLTLITVLWQHCPLRPDGQFPSFIACFIVTDNRKLLLVEDDAGLRSQLRWCFDDYEVIEAEDREGAISQLRRHEPAVILQDLGLPPDPEGTDEGFRALSDILGLAPNTKVIVVTGHGDQTNAVRAVGLGAYDFYEKPVDVDTLQLLVGRAFQIYALEEQNRQAAEHVSSPLDGIIAASDVMLNVCRMVEKIAPTDATTLLLGESGTGKELLARALHDLSSRAKEHFVAINCAAIPDQLLESELFGFEKGAFTGAIKQTPGKVETANGGTLFLDEIGDMPSALQAKLLRFLQERTVERIGGRKEISVDVRVVCATNQDLAVAIQEGRFREDLYYRISELTIPIPPLRERQGGRIVLARHLLGRAARQHGATVRGFSEDAQDAIDTYAWPGNVREMENKIKGAVIMVEGNLITAKDLGLMVDSEPPTLNLRAVRQKAETQAIRGALSRTAGNISKSAEILGITRPTLYDLIEKYEIRAAEPTD
jgi:two-component system NtrC family response regulator